MSNRSDTSATVEEELFSALQVAELALRERGLQTSGEYRQIEATLAKHAAYVQKLQTECGSLLLANKITKALYPDLYGKPGMTTEKMLVVMGTREIVEKVLIENDAARTSRA